MVARGINQFNFISESVVHKKVKVSTAVIQLDHGLTGSYKKKGCVLSSVIPRVIKEQPMSYLIRRASVSQRIT